MTLFQIYSLYSIEYQANCEWLVKNGQEIVIDYHKAISKHLLGGPVENYVKPVRIPGVWSEIQTEDLQNTKQEC